MRDKPETQSGTCTGYRVEARAAFPRVLPDGKTILTTEWRVVPFDTGPVGVKPHNVCEPGLYMFHVYNYAAAQALRWWLVSEVAPYFIETRIARYKIVYSGEKREDGYCDEVDALGRTVVPSGGEAG